ncbi:MAG: hypothetical protein HY815_24310 [Candidatus Riflebacteria bacterium]|nr:hypothetical protein [Candidatus Riflebacteria bacterium]
MCDDYANAAVRHFRDGQLLEEGRRLPNADQLFGLAAECAVKTALVTVPGVAQDGTLSDRHRQHIDRLWDLMPLQGIQRRYRGLVAVLKGLRRPFADWSIEQRYWPDPVVTDEALARHRQAAMRLLGSVCLTGWRKGT